MTGRGSRETCIIGAGLSGLTVAAVFRRRGIGFVCMERASDVGGLWRQSGAGERGPGYRSLHLNTSSRLTGYSEYPMPVSFPLYPRHDLVATYLRSFAEDMGLLDSVEFDAEVVSVRPARATGWEVLVRSRGQIVRSRIYRHVVIASGHHDVPAGPTLAEACHFAGRQLHSIDYTEAESFADRRVLVVGFGASAVDIAVELSHVTEWAMISVRRGLHVVPKQLFGMPIDELAGTHWWSEMTLEEQRRIIGTALYVLRGRLSDYGLPEPDHPLFSSALTISDDFLSRIAHGAITVKPAIAAVGQHEIRFADGTTESVDDIIYCTGYRMSFPFLPADCPMDDGGRLRLYRRVVPPGHPGLTFVGLVRPVGSITRLVELQAEWVADLAEGVATLPGRAVMQREIESHLGAVAERYGSRADHSLQVDVVPYLQALAEERHSGW